MIQLNLNPLTGMVAEICHPRVRIFEKLLQPRFSSYASVSADRRNIEESHGNFFLYNNW